MSVTFVLIVATAALCVLYLLIIAARAYQRFHGAMVVTCPETHQPAAVAVDATHAALTAMVEATELRLTQCSRWPERQQCGQECLREIELAPENCLVRTILRQWYEGKSCVLCSKPIAPIHSWDHKPGLIAVDGTVTDCTAVPAEHLQEALTTYRAVCWSCEVTEEFRRRNPGLVIEKPAFRSRHSQRHKAA
jgi:hypothetical protein